MTRILATCFFPAFDPPISGGEQKLLRFYTALSAHCDIDLVTFTYPTRSETIRHTDRFREHRIARPAAQWDRIAAALVGQGHQGEFSGVLGTLLAGQDAAQAFRATLARLWDSADVIMHDFPYVWPHEPFPADRGKLRVYNSHNLETLLTRTVFSGPDDRLHDLVEQAEATLCRTADLILATSQQEAEAMALVHAIPQARIAVVPVGFDPAAMVPAPGLIAPEAPFALFMGSLHPPNLRAGAELLKLAQHMPQMRFVLAGPVSAHLGALPPNVTALGVVDDDMRRGLFATAAAFVSPMRDGAGMNVKLSEALGAGLPVITTALGARGFEAMAEHLHIAETVPEMARALQAILEQPDAVRAALRQEIRTHAQAHLGWPALAARTARLLAQTQPRAASDRLEPITLYLNDYPLGEGQSGGQRRMLELITQTPSPGPRVLLTLTHETRISLRRHAPGFIEIGLPKTQAQRAFEAATLAHNVMSIADIATAMYLDENPLFLRWFRRLARRAGTIVLEHCYMVPALDHLPPGAAPRVLYSAHNVEADLKAQMLHRFRHTHARPLAGFVADLEARAISAADSVIAVSEQDAGRLQVLYGLQVGPDVIVNGTRIGAHDAPRPRLPVAGMRLELVFLGSAHPPNVQGLRDFLTHVWPHLQDVRLTVIGSACEALGTEALPLGVTLAGRVSDMRKAELLAQAHVAINPLTLGGGSSLKLGDYLAAGLPVVSTQAGARGTGLRDGRTALIAELGTDFAAAIDRLRNDPALWQQLAQAGQNLAHAELDWQHLGQKMARLLAPGHAQPVEGVSVLLVVSGLGRIDLSGLCGALDATGALVDLLTDAPPGPDPVPPSGLRSLHRFAAGLDAAALWLKRAAPQYDHVLILGAGALAQRAAQHLHAQDQAFAAMTHGVTGAPDILHHAHVVLTPPWHDMPPMSGNTRIVPLMATCAATSRTACVKAGPAPAHPVIVAHGGGDPKQAWGMAIAGFLQAELAGRAELVLTGEGPVPALAAGIRHAPQMAAQIAHPAAALVLALGADDFATALLAGWAAGLPVVTGPELAGLVRDGTDGVVVADPLALAAQMTALLDDPALAQRLGQAGLLRAQNDFAPEIVGAAVLTLLPTLAKSAASDRSRA